MKCSISALVLLALVSCSASLNPRLITLPDARVRPASVIQGIFDYRVAAASVLRVLERDFGFPSFPVTFYFCPGERAFEATLLKAWASPPSNGPETRARMESAQAMAEQTARNMSAVGGHRTVFVNEEALDRVDWPDRVAALAHELGHSLQYEWGGGVRGMSDQWLREGFAEWLSMQVMDRLGGVRFSDARRRYWALLRRTSASASPTLDDMARFDQWVLLGGRAGIAPYAQSFLAVDFLIEQHGMPAVVRYFDRFAEVQDREGNFRTAFGEDLGAFEQEVRTHLWGKRRQGSKGSTGSKGSNGSQFVVQDRTENLEP